MIYIKSTHLARSIKRVWSLQMIANCHVAPPPVYASGSKGSFVLARGIPDNYHDGRRSADIVFIAGEGARPESNWCVCDIFDCCHWPVGNWNCKLYRSTRMDFSSKHLYLFQLMHGAVHIEAVCVWGGGLCFGFSFHAQGSGGANGTRGTRNKTPACGNGSSPLPSTKTVKKLNGHWRTPCLPFAWKALRTWGREGDCVPKTWACWQTKHFEHLPQLSVNSLFVHFLPSL